MRDINRIRPLLNKLEFLWKLYPDWRFGQLVFNISRQLNTNDIFFPEDNKWEEVIDTMIDEQNIKNPTKTRCTCCKKMLDNKQIWFHKDGKHHLCFDCY